jgi:hypothetical protein
LTDGDVEEHLNTIASDQQAANDYLREKGLFGKEQKSSDNDMPAGTTLIPEVTERQLELKQWLSDMIAGNMSDAVKQCMGMDKAGIINMASKLTAMEDVKTFFDGSDILLRKDEYEYLCQYHDPLEIIADRWYEKSRNTDGIMTAVRDILDNRDIGSEYKKALYAAPHEIRSITENTQKPSILADLAEKMKEIKPPSEQKKNTPALE